MSKKYNTPWSTVGFLTYARTYSRKKEDGSQENFEETIERCLTACDTQLGVGFTAEERDEFKTLLMELKCSFAGRFLWQLGTRTVKDLGLPSLQNCAGVVIDSPVRPFTWAMDMLMLGSGVGFSVEKKYLKKLPKVRQNFEPPTCMNNAGADFIVPDTREGWVRLLGKTLKSAFLETKPKCTFTYSTQLIRGKGALIKGFGGVASGPEILVEGITKISKILEARRGQKITSVDAMDIMNIIGEIVIAGNIRRSSEIVLGDSDDIHYLEAKRWDLKAIPSHRSSSNNSVVCANIKQLPETFWEGYRGNGEPYGMINMESSRKQGRFGDHRYPDQDVVVYNPCVTGDTEVLTPSGYLRIDALVGQDVDVWNGFEWSNVQPRVTGTNRPTLNIVFSNGRTLRCTPNHTFVVATDYLGGSRRVEASSLEVGSKLIKHDYPIIAGTEDLHHPYTQGFVAGDGMESTTLYVYEPKRVCINRLAPSIKLQREEPRSKRLRIILNFHPKSKRYVPHSVVLGQRLDWLAGLLDADGCLLREGGVQIASVDREFLLEVQKMLTTTGVSSKVSFAREEGLRALPDQHGGHNMYPCQTVWRLLIGANEVQRLSSLGLRCERLPLQGFTPNRNAGRFVTVVDIEEALDAETVYCFTETKRHLGCFNGIVTGQCSEQSLNNYETCALAEVFLPNCRTREELRKSVLYLYRAVKHSLRLPCHHPETEAIVHKNMRMGIGATGYLQATEEQRSWLPSVYEELRIFDAQYSEYHGFPVSIKLTTQKPSGCRPASALVTTHQGILTLSEIQHGSGDLGDGDWASVDGTTTYGGGKASKFFNNGVAETYSINMSYGMSVESTANHPWWVVDKGWVQTGDIEEGDQLLVEPGHYTSSTCEPLIDLPYKRVTNSVQSTPPREVNTDLAWLIGYLWGNGSFSPEKKRLRFTSNHRVTLEKTQSILLTYGIRSSINPASNREAEILEVGCTHLYDWMVFNGFWKYREDGGPNLIPLPIRRSSTEAILAFMAGLFDADGCWGSNNRGCLSNADDQFAKHVQDVAWAVGLAYGRSHNTKGSNFQHTKSVWLLSLTSHTTKSAWEIFKKHSVKIPHDANLVFNRKFKPGLVSSVTASGTQPTFDIETAEHWFWAGAVKSHNTLSLLPGVTPGIHPGYAQYMIRRIQFSVDSPLLKLIRDNGYPTEYRQNFDGSLDYRTVVASFPFSYPEGTKLAKDMSAIDQLDVVRRAQREWSDNAVSCTVYYKQEELPAIREYLSNHWHEMKAISFLLHRDHGFKQAPFQEITKEEYDELVTKTTLITSLEGNLSDDGPDYGGECAGGSCPIR